MTYSVNVLPQAEREFSRQYRYIADRSKTGADSWANAFHRALKSLKSQPTACSLAPEGEELVEEIRQLLFKTRRGLIYRALFVVRGSEIFVIHIRGPGQDLMSIDDLRLPE